MAHVLGHLSSAKPKAFAEDTSETVAEIDAKEFRRARQDPKLRRFATAADKRLQELRSSGQID